MKLNPGLLSSFFSRFFNFILGKWFSFMKKSRKKNNIWKLHKCTQEHTYFDDNWNYYPEGVINNSQQYFIFGKSQFFFLGNKKFRFINLLKSNFYWEPKWKWSILRLKHGYILDQTNLLGVPFWIETYYKWRVTGNYVCSHQTKSLNLCHKTKFSNHCIFEICNVYDFGFQRYRD